jgi:CBS-domain-containing membrane protein
MFDRAQLLAIVVGAAVGAIAIASMEPFSARTTFPLVAIPFATSIVLVLGSPKTEPAQPRALVGGHLLSTLVGLLIVHLCGPAPWAAALAVGLAMVATGTFHPPPGIDPLVVSSTTCRGASFSRRSASARCYSRFSRFAGTTWWHEVPVEAMPGQQ